ncbi:MAG: RNA degradosome polyphosphate kinase, partial [Gemmatimonadales bacterium]
MIDTDATRDPGRFINRELSWLSFNERVLEESANPRHPALEQLRFLAISATNLDEFFMVRVAGLAAQVRADVRSRSKDGLTPREQLRAIRSRAGALMHRQQDRWTALRSELDEKGIRVLPPEALSPRENAWLEDFFLREIFPVLTPLACDPAHPFPFLPNLGYSLALTLEDQA